MIPVIVQTAWLGDAVLTFPLLRAAARLTGQRALLVTRPSLVPLFTGDPALEQIVPFDKRHHHTGPLGLLQTALRLSKALANRPAVALHPQGSWRSLLLTTLARIPTAITSSTAQGRPLAHHTVPPCLVRPNDTLALLQPLGGPPPLSPDDPMLDHLLSTTADVLPTALAHPRHEQPPKVALCVGSARATKRPPVELLSVVAERLLAMGATVVLMGSSAERPLAAAIAQRAQGPCLDVTGQSLIDAAQTLAACTLAVGGDSGLLHMGQAVGTDVLAIHGPTPTRPFERRLTARQGRRIAFVRGVPCRPCSHNGPLRCPLGHGDCMRLRPHDIERLWNLIRMQLRRSSSTGTA
ncbi:MAG: glycosyltransferase family 9 protein [Myxococcota bacterium]